MKRFFFSLLLLLYCLPGFSQLNIDSLKNILAKEKTDSITLAAYVDRLGNMSTDSMDVAVILGKWVSEQALKTKAHTSYAKAQLSLAGLYHYTNDFAPAIQYYVEAQTYTEAHGLTELHLQTLNNLANVYFQNNQYEKAEELYKITIAECEKYGITVGVATGYGSLASISYSTSGDTIEKKKKGIRYMLMSIKASESIKDTTQLIRSFSALGKFYGGVGLFDSAMYYIEKAGDLISNRTNNQEGYYYYYYYKGIALLGKKNYKAAIESFLTGLPYTKKYNTPLWESSHYEGLSDAYKALGDFKKALEYGERHFTIEDSVINAENFAKAADIQNKYEREKKDKEILQKDLQLETASQKRTRLMAFFISSLVVLGLLVVFAIVLLKNIRARKKAYTLLEEKSLKIQEQAIELSKQARLIAKFQSQMNPHFVFNALHSIQGLVISNENQKATSQIQSLAQLMRKTFANAERDDIPLEEEISYLQKYIDFEKNAFDNKLDFDIKTGEKLENVLIPPMMIQPFVENAIKHAELKKVENPYIKVLIDIEDNLLSISVKDNGMGMKKDSNNLSILSHSMSVIKARIQLLFNEKNKPAGEDLFSVQTVPDIDAGTIVKFYLPLNYAY